MVIVSTKMKLAQLHFDIPDSIILAINQEERVTIINKKGAQIIGYPKNRIVGRNWFDTFIPEKIRETMRNNFHKMLKGEIPLRRHENPILTREGSERIISWHNMLIKDEKGRIAGTLSSGADITELKLAEKILRESEERFRKTVESMIEGYQIIDCGWRYVYVNQAAAEQGRRPREELIGHTMMEMYPDIEQTEMFDRLKKCMINRVPHQMENEFTFPDGSRGWFELRFEPTHEGVLILSMDISRRKEIEKELATYRQRLEEVIADRTAECAKANRRLREEIEERHKNEEGMILRAAILDNAKEAIFLVNSSGDFVYANEAASKTYGYTHDEILNMNLRHLLPNQDANQVESRIEETIANGRLDLQTVHVKKDGTMIKVEVRHSLIKTKHGQFIVSVTRDIS